MSASVSGSGPGRLLGCVAIHTRAVAGDIFDVDTYRKDRLRGAAYDLGLARDYLITTDGRAFGPERDTRICTDAHLMIPPGEVAFVATKERLRLAWDLAANVVPKYDMARRGLFVFYGGLVDPGYGLERDDDGGWQALPDERLHFMIANVGGTTQAITFETEPIAALQFFEIEEVPPSERKPIDSAVGRWVQAAAEPERLADAMAFVATTTRQTRRLRKRTDALTQEIQRTSTLNERVVVFGIYVMAAALIGAALTALVALMSNQHGLVHVDVGGVSKIGAGGIFMLVFGVAGGILLALIVNVIARTVWAGRARGESRSLMASDADDA